MPNLLTPIASTVLVGTAASVTFASISGAYTDLVLKISARDTNASFDGGKLTMVLNSDTGTNYSHTLLTGNNSTAASTRTTSAASLETLGGFSDAASNTSSTFSAIEIYIPNYAGTANRPISVFGASEDNSAAHGYIVAEAGLYRGASAITQIVFTSTTLFAIASRFDLYGILKI
jgi:hypothetical protein